MAILDQFGRPIRYVRRTDDDLDAEIAIELDAEEERRRATTEIADNEAIAAEETVSPAEHRLACAAARTAGYFEGETEGRKAGAAAESRRFRDIARGCRGDLARMEKALAIALAVPNLSIEATLNMAVAFMGGGHHSASLADRHLLPNSLDRAKQQLAEGGA